MKKKGIKMFRVEVWRTKPLDEGCRNCFHCAAHVEPHVYGWYMSAPMSIFLCGPCGVRWQQIKDLVVAKVEKRDAIGKQTRSAMAPRLLKRNQPQTFAA